jgi:hypothetical protein
MSRTVKVKDLLKKSEARTGNRVWFIVGPSRKVHHTLITVLDSDLEVDLANGLTPTNEKLILDWFEPLAKANHSVL